MPSAEHDNSRTSNTSGGGRRRSGLLNESLTKRNNLYDTLELTKNASDDDIKRAYRRLALRYHPDKNQNNPECNKKFQEINYANSILSNPSKRRIYDEYGDMGLKMVDQFGEERLNLILRPWVKWVLCSIMVLTCGCFGCCCCCCFCFQCCCNFCCGKCKPKDMEGDNSFDEFNNNRNESEEPTVSAQPQPTNQFTSTTNITVLCELDNDNDEQTTVPGRFEPPPPYSPPSPSSPLAANQTQTTTTMPNYGSTV